jgi:hypothetical protein
LIMAVPGSLKIGTLLLQAELVQEHDLMDSVQVAQRVKLPLGRVLIGTGFLSDDMLNAALAAQSLIRDKVVSHEVAVKALKATNERGIGFEEALQELGLHSEHLEFTAKLGQLLVDSGMVSVAQRNEALQTALAAGLPIGRVLVLKRALSNLSAYAALSAQVMIRAASITREQAVEALKTFRTESCTFEAALMNAGYIQSNVSNKVMLGELLIISNQISEVDFLTALEKSLSNDLPLGTVLLESGLITKEKLDRTLDVQSKVTEGKITATVAADFLQQEDGESLAVSPGMPEAQMAEPEAQKAMPGRQAKQGTEKITAEDFVDLRHLGQANFGVPELLIMGKVITHRQANSAQEEAIRTGISLEKVLLARELIDTNVLDTANRCLLLYGMHTITAEEAILVLHAWLSKQDDLIDDVLSRIAQRDLS